GQPLGDGAIEFQPDAANAGPAVSAGALIAKGGDHITRTQGLVPGSYKGIITSHGATEPAGAPADPGPPAKPPPRLIPARYNVATTLKADVAKDRQNIFKFELKK